MESLFLENYDDSQIERIGIEIEFQLLDEKTLDLADRIEPLMRSIGEDDCITPEVFQSCIEIKTLPALNTSDAHKQIQEKMNKVAVHLAPLQLRLGSLGVHPFSKRMSRTTQGERYLSLEKEYPYITHHLFNFSTHVHISMDSLEQSLIVMNKMRLLLPVFIALSASCPYWHEEETGFVSFRQYQLKTNFNGGPPPHFHSKDDYFKFITAAHKSGAVPSLKDIHWDIKPRPDLGTLELRILDASPTIEEAMALSALTHCTIRALKTQSLEDLLPTIFKELPPDWAESINYFQASHQGIEAQYVVNSAGETFTLKQIASALLDALGPVAYELAEVEELQKMQDMLEHGLPYQRMRKIFEETSSYKEVVRFVADNLYSTH